MLLTSQSVLAAMTSIDHSQEATIHNTDTTSSSYENGRFGARPGASNVDINGILHSEVIRVLFII